jgi:two-component system sensor histidine kinase FlrB
MEKNFQNIEELKKAFSDFTSASKIIEQTHNYLKEEIQHLKEELKNKNERLAELSSLIESIIMNMRSGFIAVDLNGHIILKNNILNNYPKNGKHIIDEIIKEKSSGIYDREIDDKIFKITVDSIEFQDRKLLIYIFDDITNLKNLEKEKHRDEKLKLMGEMAANIAHEIRNPLGSVELYSTILLRSLENKEHINLTNSIIKGLRTINNIISNILVFNREINVDIRKHYVSDIVDDVVLYLRHLMVGKKIDFKNGVREEDIIYCDSEYLKQVIMNILHNSIESVKEGGAISIYSIEDDSSTKIIVEDNGCGIKKEYFDKLFIPFQTTKPKGTGLGLSIAYKIVKEHGGNIYPESDGFSYTKFTIELPKRGLYVRQ